MTEPEDHTVALAGVPPLAEVPSASAMAARLESSFARWVRPLADRTNVHGRDLHTTRAGFAALGAGRLPKRAHYWRSEVGVPGVWHHDGCGSARTGVVLYLHGGGFTWGSPLSHRALAAWLSHHARMPVFLPHYRRSPEHPYPAAVEDAHAAYRTLLARGVPSSQITVGGDSAGGHLVASLVHTLAEHGEPMPAGTVLFSPWLDLTCAETVSRDHATRDPFLSPVYAQRAAQAYTRVVGLDYPALDVLSTDKTGWPRTLIQIGGTEALLGDAERMAKSLADADVDHELQVWPGQIHVFQAFSGVLKEGRAALKHAGAFLQEAVQA